MGGITSLIRPHTIPHSSRVMSIPIMAEHKAMRRVTAILDGQTGVAGEEGVEETMGGKCKLRTDTELAQVAQ